MRMLANAIADTRHPAPQAYTPQFNNHYMGGFTPYHNDSAVGRTHAQFNMNAEQPNNTGTGSSNGEHYITLHVLIKYSTCLDLCYFLCLDMSISRI